jgi:3-hydroxyisobutyrate dehydrogenase-like beta-hydroxyacid dehydrogenase
MTSKLGFVGLGIMGRPMALNLRKAGTSCGCTRAAPKAGSR